MRLLIDTFNVLHVTGVLPPGLAGPDVAGLATLLASSRWGEAHIALVCDGTPPAGKKPKLPANIRAIYAGKVEADEILERLIADSSAPGRLLVVSSDRRVRKAAKRRGAKDLDAVSFLRALLEDRRQGRGKPESIHRPANLKPGEVNQWRDEFQVESEAIIVTDEDLPPHLQAAEQPQTQPVKPEPGNRSKKADKPPADLASLLPADLLKEARELLDAEPSPASSQPPAEEAPKPTRSDAPPIRSDLPEDIIREAEDLLGDPPAET
ncbi:MAG: NYN domain-containing protein [Phycisphaerales bacterium]|nr:NYN domain-containing protein [Phycisphaerales bacterium]